MGLFASANIIIFYILIIFPVIHTQKKTLNKDKSLESKTLNECSRCKLLSDSISYWLQKTSRGKHEGGDAAWEEAKLKSYSRSEMRLVEIQENLCSELKINQDNCYAMVEESEHALESWWFHVDRDTLNLYTWLCIDNLKHCCPPHHYGRDCSPCSQSGDDIICNNNGKCDGDGTRKGNGTCICKRGYTGDVCDKCAKKFYKTDVGSCKPCHYACDECNNDGVNACITCSKGYRMESNMCTDVNECLDSSICEGNQFCLNKEGSYSCQLCDSTCKSCTGPGPNNCSSCNINDTYWVGKCMSKELQEDILKSIYIRIFIYISLLFLIAFMFKNSLQLGSIALLIVSVIIYYLEQLQEIGITYIIFKYYITLLDK